MDDQSDGEEVSELPGSYDGHNLVKRLTNFNIRRPLRWIRLCVFICMCMCVYVYLRVYVSVRVRAPCKRA